MVHFISLATHRRKAQEWSQPETSPISQICIDDQLVQIRLASELMDVEWEVLLPDVPEYFPLTPEVRNGVKPQELLLAQDQISKMLEAVIIPDEEYSEALAIMDIVKDLASGLESEGGSPQVHMFRNWYLQLKNSSSSVLLIHLFYESHGMN